jgi:hypothetical protein
VRCEGAVDERVGRTGDRAQLDGDDVVEDAPAVGKPAMPPPSTPKTLGLLAGGIATLSRSRSASLGPVKFWKPGISPDGIPVSSTATRSARSASRAARFGKTPG